MTKKKTYASQFIGNSISFRLRGEDININLTQFFEVGKRTMESEGYYSMRLDVDSRQSTPLKSSSSILYGCSSVEKELVAKLEKTKDLKEILKITIDLKIVEQFYW